MFCLGEYLPTAREGNVFTPVSHSVHGGGGGGGGVVVVSASGCVW